MVQGFLQVLLFSPGSIILPTLHITDAVRCQQLRASLNDPVNFFFPRYIFSKLCAKCLLFCSDF